MAARLLLSLWDILPTTEQNDSVRGCMIITCPDCKTRYKTTADAIGPNGRMVRCANCTSTWFVAAESDTLTMDSLTLADIENDAKAVVPAPIVSKPTPRPDPFGSVAADPMPETSLESEEPYQGAHVGLRQRADRKRRNQRLRGVMGIWLFPLLLIGATAAGAYHFRSDVVAQFPKAATLYKAVGIDVSKSGVLLSRPQYRYGEVDGRPTLIVTGSVYNDTAGTVAMPRVALSLHNAAGEVLAQWQVELSAAKLPAGTRAEYLSQYPNPAIDGVELRSRLVDVTGGEAAMPQDSVWPEQQTIVTPLQLRPSDNE